jgi:hypothetical protein
MGSTSRGQFARLEQIHYQILGPQAFSRPEVQQRLNLDPDQVQEIRMIIRQARTETRAAATIPPGVLTESFTREEFLAAKESKAYKDGLKGAREAALKARLSAMRAIAKVLTKGQRAKYEKMVGEPFDIKGLWTPIEPPASGARQETKPETAR